MWPIVDLSTRSDPADRGIGPFRDTTVLKGPVKLVFMKVLLGVGGSEESRRALTETVERAMEAGDELTIAVFETGERDAGREAIEADVRAELDESGLDATIRHIEENPESELLRIAEEEGFDQIVISGGHASPMGKIKLGPITEFILVNAQVTVKLIR